MQASSSASQFGLGSQLTDSKLSLRSSSSSVDLFFNDLASKFTAYDAAAMAAPDRKLAARYLRSSPQRVRLRDKRPIWPNDGRGRMEPPKLTWTGAGGKPDLVPRPRMGATLTRIGAGDTALLLLFGGKDERGLCDAALALFDPLHMRWCSSEEVGAVLHGAPPSPRVGHSASTVGRHLIIYFGGKARESSANRDAGADEPEDDEQTPVKRSTKSKRSQRPPPPLRPNGELHALVQHKAPMSVNPRAQALTWSVPALEEGETPSARSHHAVAEMGPSLLLFGGEVRVRIAERDDMLSSRGIFAPVLPPLSLRAETSTLSASASAPVLTSPRVMQGGAPSGSRATLAPSGSRTPGRMQTPGTVRGERGMPSSGSRSPGRSRPATRGLLPFPTRAAPIAEREPATAAAKPPSAVGALDQKKLRWVQTPLSDTWRLSRSARGKLMWRQLQVNGEPPPRSRHTFVGLADRSLAVLFGGRSVKNDCVLNDMHVLDVASLTWVQTQLCGVPPTPCEGGSATVFGPSGTLLMFGGHGHVCHSDAVAFAIAPQLRSGKIHSEAGMWELPWPQQAEPEPRQGHVVARLGSARVLLFGGQRDNGEWVEEAPALLGECLPSALYRSCISLASVSPRRVATVGGETLKIKGAGFKPGCRYTLRFSVPSSLPLTAMASNAMRFNTDDPCVLVDRVAYVDSTTLSCVAPDMLDLMCDGYVLVEARMHDGFGGDEWWTTDEVVLEFASDPEAIETLKSIGARLRSLPVCTRHTKRLKALDALKRKPIIELALSCRITKLQPDGTPEPPPPPDPARARKGLPPAPPPCEATLTYLGDGTYELGLWTEVMGQFEVVIAAAKPVLRMPVPGPEDPPPDPDDPPPEPVETELVYTRIPITATPGATHPPSCMLHFKRVERQEDDGTIHLIAGNLCPFSLSLFDHVGNAVDGSEAKWTWYYQRLDDDEEAADTIKRTPLDPLKGDTLKLISSGTYQLHVLCNETHIPSAAKPGAKPLEGVGEGTAGDDTAGAAAAVAVDNDAGLALTAAQAGPQPDPSRDIPTIIHVTPSALSAVHSTFYGSGMHSRYPDGVEDEEREIFVIARDSFGNRLGYSPKPLLSMLSVTLYPADEEAKLAAVEKAKSAARAAEGAEAAEVSLAVAPAPAEGEAQDAANSEPPGESTPAAPDVQATLVEVPPSDGSLQVVTITDDGHGVLRAVYPILDLGSYALTISLGTELLFSATIVSGKGGKSGKGGDRPKGAPHWSEEEEIFAREHSVAMQRASAAAVLRDQAAEDLKTARFQRQFRKKGQPEPEKPKKLDADEVSLAKTSNPSLPRSNPSLSRERRASRMHHVLMPTAPTVHASLRFSALSTKTTRVQSRWTRCGSTCSSVATMTKRSRRP